MLTPQEVSQHAFAKANFGGYNMTMVDEFLDTLTEDYTTLYKENQVLKSKMKILVDKVEEYRATDESMRKAFLVAQKSAEDIVANAEAERASLIQQAEEEAQAKMAALSGEIAAEQHRLAAAQACTADYVAKLHELCNHELAYLDALPQLAAPAPSPVENTARAIEATMQKVVEEAPQERTEEEPTRDLGREFEKLHMPSGVESTSAAGETLPDDDGRYGVCSQVREDQEMGRSPRRLASDEMSPAMEKDEHGHSAHRFDHLQFGKDYEI